MKKLTKEDPAAEGADDAEHAEGPDGISLMQVIHRLARMSAEDCAKHLASEAVKLGIDLTELAERVKKLRNKIVHQIKALRAKTVENG